MQHNDHPPLILLSEPHFDGEAIVLRCAACGYEEQWPLDRAWRALQGVCQWSVAMHAVLFAAQMAREQIEAETKRDLDAWSNEIRERLGKEPQ